MAEGRYYQDIEAVKELAGDRQACEHLAAGWELLSIKEVTRTEVQGDKAVVNTQIVYILGLRKDVTPELKEPSPPPADSVIEKLKRLPFKPAAFDKTGKIHSIGPNDIPSEVKEFLKAHNSKCEDDQYSYRLSNSGWLNRYVKKA